MSREAVLFALSAVRSLAEMLGLCLLAQAALYVLAGSKRQENAVYRLFDLITQPARMVVAKVMPKSASAFPISLACFLLVFSIWIFIPIWRKFI